MMPAADPELCRLVALRTARSGLRRLKWHAAAIRFELTLRRHDRALKYGYNPNEPRVPRGNPDGGQWTTGGGSSGRVHVAGDFPTNDPPEIPKERPPKSKDRTTALKAAARELVRTGRTIAEIAKLAAWLETYSPIIGSYGDPPKSSNELQHAVSTPAPGYDIHHIVEQSAARADGFTREDIDSPDNLVRIPTMKHWEINAWYQTENPDFGGLTPRQYLSGRNWEVRRAVGLEALVKMGVLKP
jgi:hypothetical protein